MGSWDVRLLTVSYRREGPEQRPVIQLFGKTREGKSIAAEYWGFDPYFFVVEPTKELISSFKADPGVIDVKEVELLHHGKPTNCARVTLMHPWETPQYRNRAKTKGFDILAADIPFAHRFIYDMDLAACVRIHGEPMEGQSYTTELVVKAEKFENIDPFTPELKILSFDIENSIKDGRLLTLACAVRDNGSLRTTHFDGEEKDIINGFLEFVRKEDPDIITGYNIDGYDIPIFKERAGKVGVKHLHLGRDLGELQSIGDRFWRLHGRIIADAWWNVKSQLKPKQETLAAVSQLVLGEGKMDVDPTKIDEEWERDREKVIEYCIKDAELALRLLEEIAIIKKSMDLAAVSKLPLDEIINGRTATMIDSILIRAADREKVGVPMMKYGSTTPPIEGGYVHTIQPGIYHWVAVLDFKAMYPSIIIKNNICFTTLDENGTIESPIGVRFLSKDVREGILPRILESLMKERDAIKKKMKDAKTKEERDYYYGLQDAVKVLMNAFYGMFASTFYRFTDKRIGGSITAFARKNIKEIIKKLEDEGITVIYGDTDSVFFKSPYDNLEDTLRFGKEIAKRFSQDGVTLEFERVLESLFSHGKKKRYVGKVVWPQEEMLVRGYEIRRTDAFDLQEEAQLAVFEKILNDDPEGAVATAREIIKSVQEGKVPPEKLVISRTCKDPKAYKNPDAMANVQAAKKLMKMGYEFVPGMKVSWIVSDAKKSPQEVIPYIAGRKFEGEPDWDYYAHRLAHTLSYVTETFGWKERELLTGTQQVSLFDQSFDGESPKKQTKVKKTDKTLTLEDFM